jgi:hypothetical protein
MTSEVDTTYSPPNNEGRIRQHLNLFIHIVMEEGILDVELMQGPMLDSSNNK